MFYVYILYSRALDRHYIGQTGDFSGRMQFHATKATDYTAQATDWQLVFLESTSSRRAALALERRIKRTKSRLSIERYVHDGRNLARVPMLITNGDMSEWLRQGPVGE